MAARRWLRRGRRAAARRARASRKSDSLHGACRPLSFFVRFSSCSWSFSRLSLDVRISPAAPRRPPSSPRRASVAILATFRSHTPHLSLVALRAPITSFLSFSSSTGPLAPLLAPLSHTSLPLPLLSPHPLLSHSPPSLFSLLSLADVSSTRLLVSLHLPESSTDSFTGSPHTTTSHHTQNSTTPSPHPTSHLRPLTHHFPLLAPLPTRRHTTSHHQDLTSELLSPGLRATHPPPPPPPLPPPPPPPPPPSRRGC